ncbi:MAG: dihydrofolate reductase [Myxococcota bacterium]
MVAAVSRNGVIGRGGELPWHIPGDLAFFKRTTMGHAILMGRRTYDSVGKPLPGRRNIVVTRQPDLVIPGCDVVHSLQEAIATARAGGDSDPHVVGGSSLYTEAMPLATRLILTEVDQDVEDGDTFFPEFNRSAWEEVSREAFDGYAFTELVRR